MGVKSIFAKALVAKASGKTSRYFLENHESDIVRLVNTVNAVRNAGRNNAIETGAGKYYAEEYQFPHNVVDYINTKHVYFNAEADGIGNFMPVNEGEVVLEGHGAVLDPWSKKFNDTTTVMSPEQVNAFFRKYNDNQEQDEKIDLVPVKFERLHLSDFKELVVKTDGPENFALVDWNNSGSKSGYLAIISNLQSPIDSKYLSLNKMPNAEEVVMWIFRE